MKELQAIQKADPAGFEVSVPDESYAFLWEVDFFDFEKGTPLAKDLQKVRGGRMVGRRADLAIRTSGRTIKVRKVSK